MESRTLQMIGFRLGNKQVMFLLGAFSFWIFVFVILVGIRPSRILKSRHYECPMFRAPTADCVKLFHGDLAEQNRTRNLTETRIPDGQFKNLTFDCDAFIHDRRYFTKSTSGEEIEFPLAFNILMYEEVEQFERLLRAIYRQQNYYCVHVDRKSKQTIRDSVGAIASCFENVFVAQKTVDVRWGYFSVLEPELYCMEELLKYKKWKYFINLTGKEWPLKTNLELVKILRAIKGSNILEGTKSRYFLFYLRAAFRNNCRNIPNFYASISLL